MQTTKRDENKENFQTPASDLNYCESENDRDEEVSVESNDEPGDDLYNATQFRDFMLEKGHIFKTYKGKLLWYDPSEGVYQEESPELRFKLSGLFADCPVLGRKYQGTVGKHSALFTMLKTIVVSEPDFFVKAQENTKGYFAFNNCIWDFKNRTALEFDPQFYFTFKAPVDYKKHETVLENEVRVKVFESIFGTVEKCNFFASLLSRALAGDIEDKRFVVLIGKTNSGKGCLTQILGDCFGLGTFVGNYLSKNLQGESNTLSWLLQNKNCRIILANEIDTKRPILANNIRMCANGGEPITASAKYINEENFIPQGTMFLFCNEMPEIKGNDDGDAVKNRMVYVETEFKHLKQQEYEEEKMNPKVRLLDPTLKTEYLKRKDVREVFARLICKAYVPEAPPLPECCVKKALEYQPPKTLRKRLEEVLDFTGNGEDYVFACDVMDEIGLNATVLGTEMGKINGVVKKKERFDKVQKVIYRGVKWKGENTTQDYEEGDTSTDVSFARVNDVEMTSPIKGSGEVLGLKTENEDLKARLEKALEEVSCLNEALEKAQSPQVYYEVCDETMNQVLSTTSQTVRTSTAKKAIQTALAKIDEKENINSQKFADLEDTFLAYRQRYAELEVDVARLKHEKNEYLLKKNEEELVAYELYEEEAKNKEYVALIKHIERKTKTVLLDDDGKVLKETMKKVKDQALVDTFSPE